MWRVHTVLGFTFWGYLWIASHSFEWFEEEICSTKLKLFRDGSSVQCLVCVNREVVNISVNLVVIQSRRNSVCAGYVYTVQCMTDIWTTEE